MGQVEQNKIAGQKFLLFKKGVLQEKGNQNNHPMTKNNNNGTRTVTKVMKECEPLDNKYRDKYRHKDKR
jgi:hypothetical protein